MYPPALFSVENPDELKALLHATGLGTLITPGSDGLTATHLPFFYDDVAGTLRGHMSRANPHTGAGETQAFILFHRMDAYVTPSWYPSKQRHGRVAPTWNYEFIHVRGSLRWIDDAEWLLQNLNDITDRYEARQAHPWKVNDAPADFADRLIPHVIGMEIAIERVECRRKMSQNQNDADRNGVIDGLLGSDDPKGRRVAQTMAALLPTTIADS